jgi:hypothetical protein
VTNTQRSKGLGGAWRCGGWLGRVGQGSAAWILGYIRRIEALHNGDREKWSWWPFPVSDSWGFSLRDKEKWFGIRNLGIGIAIARPFSLFFVGFA